MTHHMHCDLCSKPMIKFAETYDNTKRHWIEYHCRCGYTEQVCVDEDRYHTQEEIERAFLKSA